MGCLQALKRRVGEVGSQRRNLLKNARVAFSQTETQGRGKELSVVTRWPNISGCTSIWINLKGVPCGWCLSSRIQPFLVITSVMLPCTLNQQKYRVGFLWVSGHTIFVTWSVHSFVLCMFLFKDTVFNITFLQIMIHTINKQLLQWQHYCVMYNTETVLF